jgi:hypothetical protein
MEPMFCIQDIPQSETVFSFSRKNIEAKTPRTYRSFRRLSLGAAALHWLISPAAS